MAPLLCGHCLQINIEFQSPVIFVDEVTAFAEIVVKTDDLVSGHGVGDTLYIDVAALLTARPGRPGAVVRERAMRTLYDFINPLTGGPEGNGWPFDADLNAAQVFQILDAVEGVERVDEVLFFEYDLRNQQRMGFGKEMVQLGSDSLFLSTNHQVVVR